VDERHSAKSFEGKAVVSIFARAKELWGVVPVARIGDADVSVFNELVSCLELDDEARARMKNINSGDATRKGAAVTREMEVALTQVDQNVLTAVITLERASVIEYPFRSNVLDSGEDPQVQGSAYQSAI
jgi:hypothetical protein